MDGWMDGWIGMQHDEILRKLLSPSSPSSVVVNKHPLSEIRKYFITLLCGFSTVTSCPKIAAGVRAIMS